MAAAAAHFLVHCREFGSPNCRSVGALADAHATTAGKQRRDGGEREGGREERSLHCVRVASATPPPLEAPPGDRCDTNSFYTFLFSNPIIMF